MILEKNEQIVFIIDSDYKNMTPKEILQVFWETDSKIIYILNSKRILYGIITIGVFLDKWKNGKDDFINRDFSTIIINAEEDILYQAKELLFEKNITTAIPVVNNEGVLCLEVVVKDEIKEDILSKYKNDINKYKQSNYLKEEMLFLKDILENQKITVIGSEHRFKENFGEIISNSQKVSFLNEKIDCIYDLLCNHKNLLIDLNSKVAGAREYIYFTCNNGYNSRLFYNKILEQIELERFSCFYEILDNPDYTLYDFWSEHVDGRVEMDTNSLFYSLIKNYLEKKGKECRINSNLFRKERVFINWKRESEKNLHTFENLEAILELVSRVLNNIRINNEIGNKNSVINIYIGDKIKLNTNEKKRFKSSSSLENLNKNNELDNLYRLKNIEKGYFKKLIEEFNPKSRRSFENDIVMMDDCNKSKLHIENGIRKTLDQPKEYLSSIFTIGPCTMCGAYVEDSDTIASILQKKLIEKNEKVRVVNLGHITPVKADKFIRKIKIDENDIFIIYWIVVPQKLIKKLNIKDISEKFNYLREKKYSNAECFLDMLSHCGFNGNLIFADLILSEISFSLNNSREVVVKKNNIYDIFKTDYKDLEVLYDFNSFKKRLLKLNKNISNVLKNVGCIVMNCNPFTYGHRYLIEKALEQVDYLYIFVVEEDKSYFTFKERLEMVQKGTSDLENVFVMGSGKTIVSNVTFSQYFGVKYISDTQEEKISTVIDLRVFSQYIAPEINIRYRFIGEEPLDNITKQYNETMKQVLPDFGIKVIEIPRKENENGEIISASKVRKAFDEKRLEYVKNMIPNTTHEYLMDKYIKQGVNDV